jgi:murein DD-endopeptidase MepM/ murein hydrolase activator NlpD
MCIDLIKKHKPIFSNPLPLPLKVIRNSSDENFKAEGLFMDYRNTANPPSRNPPFRPHEGIDFRDKVSTPVFATRPGWVVDIVDNASPPEPGQRAYANISITIRHIKEEGQAFVTRYKHLKLPTVKIGDVVNYGTKIGEISKVPGMNPHLHYEIHLMMSDDPAGSENWHWRNTEKIDPTPYMYQWDKLYYERIKGGGQSYSTMSAAKLDEIAVMRDSSLSIFRIKQNNRYYFLPLPYLDAGEGALVDLLKEAFYNGHKVRLAARDTAFFKITYDNDPVQLIYAARILK